jgi:hypothetical protein
MGGTSFTRTTDAGRRRSAVEPLGHCCPPTLRALAIRLAKRTGGGHTSGAMWRRGAIIAAVFALSIAMTVAWGWAAGMAFGFAGAIALARMAGVIIGGTLIQQAGRSYYERQLRGRRRAP